MEGMQTESNSALIVIDVQKGFFDPGWGPGNNPECEPNVDALIQAWRAAKRPIVVVRHDAHEPDSTLHPSNPGNSLQDFVAAAPHDLLVSKSVNSAFYGRPDLHGWLQERGIRQIVICGIQTNMCVETTARMGGNLGYDVIVPLDATRTFNLSGPRGDSLAANELARATAVNLQGGEFARVVATVEVLDA